uniref:RING-type domain-containing protein n=1 Tax=Athene cunicularia TaxID=194338 RepID=A0A663N2R8_ATHCN
RSGKQLSRRGPGGPGRHNVERELFRCPICLNTWDKAALTMPCLHRFCFSCLWQRVEIKLECPICRKMVRALQGECTSEPSA